MSTAETGGATSPGPLSLLAVCLCPAAGAVAVDRADVGVVCVAAELLLLGWLMLLAPSWRAVAVRFAVSALAAASIGASTWLYGDHRADAAWGAVLRVGYLVIPAVIVTASIRPGPLGDSLAQRLHLPARPVVAAVAALQRLESLGDQWRQVHRARRARGLGADGGPIRRARNGGGAAFALLVVAMRQSGSLAVAMECRGFAGATRRTWAQPAPWRRSDAVVLAFALVLAALPWIVAGAI